MYAHHAKAQAVVAAWVQGEDNAEAATIAEKTAMQVQKSEIAKVIYKLREMTDEEITDACIDKHMPVEHLRAFREQERRTRKRSNCM